MIQRLPQSLINQIAAGEVIQRPCNVIKELIQNSIDAGSTQIHVSLQQGGLKQIKIVDNGKGIMVEDFPLLCARFATSKIKQFGDLRALSSFGFRGEALASLSYVSNLTVNSKWCEDTVGHMASFKNEELIGKVIDAAMNTGTTIIANELFLGSESRRASLNPLEQKKKIYKVLCHFSLHYEKITFKFSTEKGEETLPSSRLNSPQSKMQIFQQITKLSYDKFTYISNIKIGPDSEIEAIITKINACKGKTLMLNINNRIVENPDLFRSIQKAYSECYQSIHQDIESFWVYLNLTIEPKLIDCNVHPTKKAVGLFAGQDIYERIREVILGQIRKDSAIKILKPSTMSEKSKTTLQSLQQKMALNFNPRNTQTQQSEKAKSTYAFQKNRTDSKQLPLQFFSQPNPQQKLNQKNTQYFEYCFSKYEKDLEMKKFFGEVSYVGCYGLNYILIHYQNKLFMLNTVDLILSYTRSFAQNNQFALKQIKKSISISQEIQNFVAKTKILPESQSLLNWISNQSITKLIHDKFGIQIESDKIISYPCFGDVFVQCMNQEQTIGQQIAYLLCRVYNATFLGKFTSELEDKFFADFISAQFIENNNFLSPFNDRINNMFKNKIVPVLKTNPSASLNPFNPIKSMKQMLDLKDIYKIFQRC